jgi:Resolvase, N terminal domain
MSEINVAQPPLSEGCETVSGMGHLLGYARVSTTDQHPQLQVDALQRAGCYRVFTETASGARSDRPTLAQVLDQLRPGDTLVVWKLDRLGRSLRHLVDTVTDLADRGIGFRSSRRPSTPPPPAASSSFTCLRPWPSSNATSSANAPAPASRRSGPGSPWRPTLGYDHPQGPGGTGDVPLGAVHGGRDRQDPRGQPGLDLSAPHRPRPVTTSPFRGP